MKFEEITPAIVGRRVETVTGCAMGFNRKGTISSIEEEKYSRIVYVNIDEPVWNGEDRYTQLALWVRSDNKIGSALGWNFID